MIARYCANNTPSSVRRHFTGTNATLVTLSGMYLYLVQTEKSTAGQWWLPQLPKTTKLNLHSSSLGQHRISTTRAPLFKEESV